MAVASRQLVSLNPATLDEVGRVEIATADEVADAVAAARVAGRRWSRARAPTLLAALAQSLLDHADEIARTITAETGKPLVEAYTIDVFTALENLVWLARRAGSVLEDEPVETPLWLRHKRPRVVYEPLGVVAILGPWNVPLAIPLTQAAAAVAAGNGTVVKPSERAPLTGAWIERLCTEAGAPEGLVRVVQGGPETGAMLVASAGVGRVLFTGSTAGGRSVAAAAAERLCPVTLELGGKDPMIVLADADLDRAVRGAAWAAFAGSGQLCAGVERIYVQEEVFDPFVARLAERAVRLRVGSGEGLETEIGPLIAEEERARVEALLGEAIDRGAVVRAGGRRPDVGLPGWFYAPTVVTGTGFRDEEVFGPLVSVEPFAGEAEAVERANDSRFGLGASVWTGDRDRAARLASELDAGMVWTNDHAYSYGLGAAPWGGRGASGFARTHSRHGLYDLASVKLVDSDRGRIGAPWWFPYDRAAAGAFAGLLEVLYRPGARAKAAAAWRNRIPLLDLAARYVSRR
jgi:acyl-CoA reductase-like NAD-dependent aldehyde dehydrogenase